MLFMYIVTIKLNPIELTVELKPQIPPLLLRLMPSVLHHYSYRVEVLRAQLSQIAGIIPQATSHPSEK